MSEQKIRLAYFRQHNKTLDATTLNNMTSEERNEYIDLYHQQEAELKVRRRKSAIMTTIYIVLMVCGFIAIFSTFYFYYFKDERYIRSKVSSVDSCEIVRNSNLYFLADGKFRVDENDSRYDSGCLIYFKNDGSNYFATVEIDADVFYKNTEGVVEEVKEDPNKPPVYLYKFDKNYYNVEVAISHRQDILDENTELINENARDYAKLIGLSVKDNLPFHEDYLQDR